MHRLIPIGFVFFLMNAGCSFLEDPPPYQVLNPDMDAELIEDAAARLDFAQRTNDAFIPLRPPSRTRDMMPGDQVDQDASTREDMGQGELDAAAPLEGIPTCVQECQSDEDCADGARCEDGTCQGAQAADVCSDPELCLAAQSDWSIPCTGFNECPQGQACIRVDEVGLCAPLAGDMTESSGCDNPEYEALVRRDFMTNGELNVCGHARAACLDDACTLACRSDEDCGSDPQYPSCDVESGRCVCGAGRCQFNASVCGDDGRCGCAQDADCTELGLDTCLNERCVCSSDEGCSEGAITPGTYRCIIQ